MSAETAGAAPHVLGPVDQIPLGEGRAFAVDGQIVHLRPGGRLVYATCSLLRAENEAVLASFMARHSEAAADALDEAWGRPAGVGRQMMPGEEDADGFFYARLRRRLP